MKATKIYHCDSLTAAKDSANLYYISAPTATGIITDTAAKCISIFTRFKEIARFVWA
jgi:hypothetical protein